MVAVGDFCVKNLSTHPVLFVRTRMDVFKFSANQILFGQFSLTVDDVILEQSVLIPFSSAFSSDDFFFVDRKSS